MNAVEADTAEAYERYLVPAFFKSWAIDLVGQGGLTPGDRVLDAGCGTGIVARFAAGTSNAVRVTGVDHAPAYLAVARRLDSDRLVRWYEADVAELPFAQAAFDVALCQQGVQFFGDRRQCVGELRRVLRPGGRLVASVWSSIDRSPGFAALAAALDDEFGLDAGAALRNGPFSMPDAGELAALTGACGFDRIEVVSHSLPARFPSTEQFVRRFLSSYPVDAVKTRGEEAISTLLAEVRRLLGRADDRGELTFSIEANVVTAAAGRAGAEWS